MPVRGAILDKGKVPDVVGALGPQANTRPVVQLEPARFGILLMSGVVVRAVSAAWLAAEHLNLMDLMGGALVLCAGVLEVFPELRRVADHQ
ncbi:hypothetical protein FIU86_21210 (plasmid) [Roseovarius sp. THAF9]|nr:hypothetical protein FIU86_21210 [Roseovarius sp. THAF9]